MCGRVGVRSFHRCAIKGNLRICCYKKQRFTMGGDIFAVGIY